MCFMSEVPVYELSTSELFKKSFGRKHGLSAEQFPVSDCVGSSKNLKDLKEVRCVDRGGLRSQGGAPHLDAAVQGCLTQKENPPPRNLQ